MNYPKPVNEALRLRRLHEIQLAVQGKRFDHIARVAREHLKTPIALVSLVDQSCQIFAGRAGLDLAGTPREHAFCNHAVVSSELFEVEDARFDPRFARNPLVLGPPYIRFYAGAPIIVEPGLALGTVCVIDTVPRRLSFGQRIVLKHIAQVAEMEIAAAAAKAA